MATITKFFSAAAAIPMFIFLANLQGVRNEPAISASPAVFPSVNAPNMSSFFPSQSPPQWPTTSSAVPPDSEAFAPIPSSGEFVGKSSCTSANSNAAIVMLLQLFTFLVIRLISTV
ncbi:pentatricopeptide repeat-containing protein [Corchorus capsularis]|uniref:Pentatricopeptide repeat-containing protein n=1 Tax=Corchorus capsularis TaxID=210143 RepID=A0A1R3ISE1_COCAP|nr:pentatricopeptide repeat-containing protein [Corchorus capsularis]